MPQCLFYRLPHLRVCVLRINPPTLAGIGNAVLSILLGWDYHRRRCSPCPRVLVGPIRDNRNSVIGYSFGFGFWFLVFGFDDDDMMPAFQNSVMLTVR